jgi:hypothetical protein
MRSPLSFLPFFITAAKTARTRETKGPPRTPPSWITLATQEGAYPYGRSPAKVSRNVHLD